MAKSLDDEFSPVNDITPVEPLSAKHFQDLFNNDLFLYNNKLEGALRNTKPKNKNNQKKPRKHPHKVHLQDNLAMFAKSERFRLSNSLRTQVGNDTRYSWLYKRELDSEYRFPTNSDGAYFDSDYIPVVVITLLNAPQSLGGAGNYPGLIAVLENIQSDYIEFAVHQINGNQDPPDAGSDIWINIFAMGRKGKFFTESLDAVNPPIDEGDPGQFMREKAHNFDAYVFRGVVHHFDAITTKRISITNLFDSSIKKSFTKTHAFDAKIPTTRPHAIDALLKKTLTVTHSFDVSITVVGTDTYRGLLALGFE